MCVLTLRGLRVRFVLFDEEEGRRRQVVLTCCVYTTGTKGVTLTLILHVTLFEGNDEPPTLRRQNPKPILIVIALILTLCPSVQCQGDAPSTSRGLKLPEWLDQAPIEVSYGPTCA